ncbi:MAG: hypothetical protein HY925_16480 [Elusimicrobia bacterium]|nr:hypothetical protein [Elusimicrobiota bacterium]
MPPAPRPVSWDPKAAARELKDLAGRCDSEAGCRALERKLDARLAELPQPDYFCMTRHILESVRRAARLAPLHDTASRAKGLESPYGVSRQFIKTQLLSLSQAWTLDEWAVPVQAKGVPILCRDVPPIP